MRLTVDAPLDVIEHSTRLTVEKLAPFVSEMERVMQDPINEIDIFTYHLPGKKILDVGCGWSRYVNQFIDRGLQYTGIDLSTKMVALSRQKYPQLKFEEMSFRKLKFEAQSFDGLWCCTALHHEPKRNIQQVLQEMRRVLVPGGILLVMLPYLGYSEESIQEVNYCEGEQAYCSIWDTREFEAELKSAHFILLDSIADRRDATATFLARA